MTDTRRCPQCGTEIPAAGCVALCPKCLLAAGFSSEPGSGPTEALPPSGSSNSRTFGFVPPNPDALAARFPQLEILELLGKGGMGAVYKARQRGLDRLVALKILPPEVGADTAFAERFTREARALAQLSHSNIVGVFDFGQADGLYYFIMEYVDGVNLRQAILAGEMQPKEVLAIVPQICDALQFAHDEGIVHRDIKPENILIDKRGRVKIADFGLARLLGREQTDPRLTATQQVMGTLRYMAPEQLEGSHDVDHRADIYSLGVVFYELLTGELPIGRFAPPSKKVQIDVRLDEVVLRALEKEPEQRWQHASELRTSVDRIIGSTDGTAERASAGRKSDLLPTAPDAKLSKCALAGAIWAPFVLALIFVAIATIVPAYTVRQATPGEALTGMGFFQIIALCIAAVFALVGFSAPFGTTILGVVAIGQIRRSAGKLYGLPLAVFDALLFPLLFVNLMLLALGFAVAYEILSWLLANAPNAKLSLLAPLLLDLLVVGPLCIWLDWWIVRAVWRYVTGYEPPSKPMVAKPLQPLAHAELASPEVTKGQLPMRFLAKTMLLAAIAWPLVPLLWNTREAGLAVAALTIAGMTIYIARQAERFLPATAEQWRKRRPIERWLVLAFSVLFSTGGVYFIFCAGYQAWERLNWNISARSGDDFRQEYQGAEHRLLQRLDAFKTDVPRAEMVSQTYRWVGGWSPVLALPPSIGLFMGFSICSFLFMGMFLILGTFLSMLHYQPSQFSFGWSKIGWPAMQLTMSFLLPLLMYVIVLFPLVTLVSGTMFFSAPHVVKTPEDISSVVARMDAWAATHGFSMGDEFSWKLIQVPKGESLARVEQRHLWRPNVFDRWQMTRLGLQRIAPDISLEIVGNASGKETVIALASRTRRRDAETDVLKAQLEGLYDALKDPTSLPRKVEY